MPKLWMLHVVVAFALMMMAAAATVRVVEAKHSIIKKQQYTTKVISSSNNGDRRKAHRSHRRAATTMSIIDEEEPVVVAVVVTNVNVSVNVNTSSSAEEEKEEEVPSPPPPLFALIPKLSNNPFFDVSGEGCQSAAERLGVKCLYIGPEEGYDPTGQAQVKLVEELLVNRTELNLQGLAISAVNATSLGPVIEKAMTVYEIPVITFDSDAPDSQRIAYTGTDNYFFGTQLAKVLKQVHPAPGQFAIVSDSAPNIQDREKGVRDHLLREGWQEVSTSPSHMNANSTLVVEQMFAFANESHHHHHPDDNNNLTAIIPVMGAGMRAPDNYWSTFVKAHPDILLVVGDAMANQLELLDRQQCAGLVGQLPYEMGVLSIETLYKLYTAHHDNNNMLGNVTDTFIGTNVLEHLLIPLILPELKVDNNLVGELRYVGYCLFSLVAAMAFGFATWTFVNREARVVKVAQPAFLILVAVGSLVMAAAVLPLGFDDFTHDEQLDRSHSVGICMSPFWLLAFGFSLVFSSLFAKIYRVNLLFEAAKRFGRMESSSTMASIVMSPLILLSFANGIILTLWTVLDPLEYVRLEHSGTDGWDRAVSTYGTCQGENAMAYLLPLTALNGIMLVFANWIAYKTRKLDEEFAESKYVGMAMASMLQAALTGIPILFIVQKSPQAFYMVEVFMIFITCSAILLLIFVPKMVLFHQYQSQPQAEQQARLHNRIRRSTLTAGGRTRSHDDSVLSDDESGFFQGGLSSLQTRSRTQLTNNNSLTFSQSNNSPEQPPQSCCDCNCHIRPRAPKSEGASFQQDALGDKTSWGGGNLSTLLKMHSVTEGDNEEAGDFLQSQKPLPRKREDVLTEKSSGSAGQTALSIRDIKVGNNDSGNSSVSREEEPLPKRP